MNKDAALAMTHPTLEDLDARARATLRLLVEAHLAGGAPIASRELARPLGLSSASVRGVMADLEAMGLLYAPHVSAGRLPTEAGLRLFVDGVLGAPRAPTALDAQALDSDIAHGAQASASAALDAGARALAGLAHCAGVAATPRMEDARLAHIEFVPLRPGRALAVLAATSGMVENRVIETPAGVTPMALAEAGAYMNARMRGLTLAEARARLKKERAARAREVDAIAARLVDAGVAAWSDAQAEGRALLVRGRAALMDDAKERADLERLRALMDALDKEDELARLLEEAERADGAVIFIGAETRLFALSGAAMIAAAIPGPDKPLGVVGVVGPARLNYARIVPMVVYAAGALGGALAGADDAGASRASAEQARA